MSIFSRFGFGLGLLVLIATGCEWESPLTSSPTRKVLPSLLGEWKGSEEKEKLKIARLNDKEYVLVYEDELYRAFHSDFQNQPLVSVQELGSEGRRWSVIHFQLAPDGRSMTLKALKGDLVAKKAKSTSALQKEVKKLLQSTNVFGEAAVFRRIE